MSEKFVPAANAADYLNQVDEAKKAQEVAAFWNKQLGDEVINGDRDSEESQKRIEEADEYAKHLEEISKRSEDYDPASADEGIDRNSIYNLSLKSLVEKAKSAHESGDDDTAQYLHDIVHEKLTEKYGNLVLEGKLSKEEAEKAIDRQSEAAFISVLGDVTESGLTGNDKVGVASKGFQSESAAAKPNHLLITDDEAPIIEAESPRQESHQDLGLGQEASDNIIAKVTSENVKSQAEGTQSDTDTPLASPETNPGTPEVDAASVEDALDEKSEKEQSSGRIRKFGRFALKALGINKYRAYRADKRAFIDTRKQEYNYEETPFVALDQAKRDYRKQKRAERTEKVKSFFNDAGLTEEGKAQKQAQIDRNKAARQARKEAGDTVSQKAKQAAQNVYAKSKDGYSAFREKGRARFGVNPDAAPSDRAKEVADELVGRTPEAAKKAEERARRQAGTSEPVERSNVAPSPYDVNSTEVIDTVPLPQQDSEGSVQYPDTRNRRQNPADNRDAA